MKKKKISIKFNQLEYHCSCHFETFDYTNFMIYSYIPLFLSFIMQTGKFQVRTNQSEIQLESFISPI